MKKFFIGLVILSFGLLLGTEANNDVGNSVKKENLGEQNCIEKGGKHRHRGPRGPRGHRGRRGFHGKEGHVGSFIFDRAYLAVPSLNPLDIPLDGIPFVVPFIISDLGNSIFHSSQNAFIVSESGVYRVDYFINARGVIPAPLSPIVKGVDVEGFLQVGVVIDDQFSTPQGFRSLPIYLELTTGDFQCWGTHEVFIPLVKNQKVRLCVLGLPLIESQPLPMQLLSVAETNQIAYLSLEKVGPLKK
jgi:hypothetical protein